MNKEMNAADQLSTYVWGETRSVALMDKFEGIGRDNDTRYERMVFLNNRYGRTNTGKTFKYNLVIERRKQNAETAGDITFTEFKQGYTWELGEHINASVCDKDVQEYSGKEKIFYLDKPFRFRAQNSSNRTGYGWTWEWHGGYGDYTEGTYYGETTEYVFAGIYIA